MLGTTLWLVAVLGLVATLSIDAAAGFGRASLHAAADHAVEGALHDAVADYQNALQAAIAAAAPERGSYAAALAALPDPLERTLQPPAGDPAMRFTIGYRVTRTTLGAPACAPGAAGSASVPDTIAWLQCDAAVQESRISLHVVVRVLDAVGQQTIAQRGDDVSLRLFAVPPYSALVGRRDAAASDPTQAQGAAAHEGDLGGDTVSGASPAPAAGSWPAGGTLIHVRYQCRDGAGSCANAAPPDPDAGLRAGAGWANGNRPPP